MESKPPTVSVCLSVCLSVCHTNTPSVPEHAMSPGGSHTRKISQQHREGTRAVAIHLIHGSIQLSIPGRKQQSRQDKNIQQTVVLKLFNPSGTCSVFVVKKHYFKTLFLFIFYAELINSSLNFSDHSLD